MITNLPKWFTTAASAGRDLLCLVGAIALSSFYGVERSLLWLGPATLILAALAWVLFKIEVWRHTSNEGAESDVRRKALTYRAAGHRSEKRAAVSAVSAVLPTPLKHKRTWALLDAGTTVGYESDRRAVDNWLGLGPQCDARIVEAQP
jgi:hypothetical protein